MKLDSQVTCLPGVGKKRAEMLLDMGIKTVKDILYHFPYDYRDTNDTLALAMTPDGTAGAFLLTVATQPKTVMLKNRMKLTKFTAFDQTGKCNMVFFNQPYLSDVFHVGEEFVFWGKLTWNGKVRDLAPTDYVRYGISDEFENIIPLYRRKKGLSKNFFKDLLKYIFDDIKDGKLVLDDIIPEEIRKKENVPEITKALYDIHFPSSTESAENAKRRFAFEEAFVFSLAVNISRQGRKSGRAVIMKKTGFTEFSALLPYKLTSAQLRSINEIYSDMADKNGNPMGRLLSGDVGSGKTVCAMAAAYCAFNGGTQTALMAPTEILARQHYNDMKPFFDLLGMETVLLVGSNTAKERREALEKIKSGQAGLVIGTHAILTENVVFDKLGLVITDEQHRFGVKQRTALSDKADKAGIDAHVLVMSATPIPRTLALILYGDLDISVLDEMPPGRQKVDTFLVDESYRQRLNGFIHKIVGNGNQVYIVCPAVENEENDEDTDDDDGVLLLTKEELEKKNAGKALKSAVKFAEELKNGSLSDLNVGVIHGKMNGKDKDRIMKDFVNGNIDVLVSTTVIEVGVNVPNATLMIVENAERFGLSQLHQLRGRVGRGKDKSYCILVSSCEGEKARERLNVMCKLYNGYKIAEQDLEQRGPGDFLPNDSGDARQSGKMAFRYSALFDMELLKRAFTSAEGLIKSDLSLEKYPLLREEAEKQFGKKGIS